MLKRKYSAFCANISWVKRVKSNTVNSIVDKHQYFSGKMLKCLDKIRLY